IPALREMSLTFCYHGPLPLKLRLFTVRAVNSPEPAVDSIDSGSLRLQLLERVDEELKKGNERGALSLIKDTHGKPGGLRCFGTARQVICLDISINTGKVSAKLDTLLKSLGFTQKKADSQVRWAVLNTILLLRRHEKARSQLAEAMSLGKSVGSCIDVIENTIDAADV
ncbi:hypothetical protein B296_00017738, partial [Ensete ventricosum]